MVTAGTVTTGMPNVSAASLADERSGVSASLIDAASADELATMVTVTRNVGAMVGAVVGDSVVGTVVGDAVVGAVAGAALVGALVVAILVGPPVGCVVAVRTVGDAAGTVMVDTLAVGAAGWLATGMSGTGKKRRRPAGGCDGAM